MTRILRGCSLGANSDLCDSCESYWKAEGEKPPCEDCKNEKDRILRSWTPTSRLRAPVRNRYGIYSPRMPCMRQTLRRDRD